MSQHLDEPTRTSGNSADPACEYHREDVRLYYQANLEIENNRHHIEEAR
mgnify:FL=1